MFQRTLNTLLSVVFLYLVWINKSQCLCRLDDDLVMKKNPKSPFQWDTRGDNSGRSTEGYHGELEEDRFTEEICNSPPLSFHYLYCLGEDENCLL